MGANVNCLNSITIIKSTVVFGKYFCLVFIPIQNNLVCTYSFSTVTMNMNFELIIISTYLYMFNLGSNY